MEVTNRFKGLDLIDRVPEELWTEVQHIIQEMMAKPQRRRNARSQSGCLRRLCKYLRDKENQKEKEKGKVTPS